MASNGVVSPGPLVNIPAVLKTAPQDPAQEAQQPQKGHDEMDTEDEDDVFARSHGGEKKPVAAGGEPNEESTTTTDATVDDEYRIPSQSPLKMEADSEATAELPALVRSQGPLQPGYRCGKCNTCLKPSHKKKCLLVKAQEEKTVTIAHIVPNPLRPGERCGKCKTCLNLNLKKGCLTRKKQQKAMKDAMENAGILSQEGGQPPPPPPPPPLPPPPAIAAAYGGAEHSWLNDPRKRAREWEQGEGRMGASAGAPWQTPSSPPSALLRHFLPNTSAAASDSLSAPTLFERVVAVILKGSEAARTVEEGKKLRDALTSVTLDNVDDIATHVVIPDDPANVRMEVLYHKAYAIMLILMSRMSRTT